MIGPGFFSKQRRGRSLLRSTHVVFGILFLMVTFQGTAPCCVSSSALIQTASSTPYAIPCLDAAHHAEDQRLNSAASHPDIPFNLPSPGESTMTSHASHTLLVLLLARPRIGLLLRHRVTPIASVVLISAPSAVAVPPPRPTFS